MEKATARAHNRNATAASRRREFRSLCQQRVGDFIAPAAPAPLMLPAPAALPVMPQLNAIGPMRIPMTRIPALPPATLPPGQPIAT